MSYPPAGSLQHHLDQWEQISTPLAVLTWLRDGVQIPFSRPIRPFCIRNRSFSAVESSFVDAETTRLLACGAIERCISVPEFISPLHCVPKKKSGFRLILNLSHLNGHIDPPRFRNDDIRTVAEYINNNDHLTSLDITNGFYHIPVSLDYRQFLCFQWKGVYYRFTVTPFGLCLSPFYFCKTLRPVIAYLRDLGVRLSVYVDDFCLAAPKSLARDHTDLLIDTLTDLGFHINIKKSQLVPVTSLDYIGYTIRVGNANGLPFIAAQSRRITQLRRDIGRALKRPSISARSLARLAGQCISIAWCVEPAKLMLRGVYRLLTTKSTWTSLLTLDSHTREDLLWWKEAITFWNGKSVCNRPIEAQVITDASHLAWGAVLGPRQAGGDWDFATSRKSSNYRELFAILLALKSFLPDLVNKSIQILSDNITAIAYIQHKGGPNPTLTAVARSIWTLAVENGIYLDCRHIAGRDNTEADRISRLPDKHDWQLHPSLFAYLDSLWGPHTIDRFASYLNRQTTVYNSRFADPHSSGVDALAQTNWREHNNFVNAPFCLLARVLDLVCQQKATATVIAPFWRAQPFVERLRRLSIRPPIALPQSDRLFSRRGVLPEPIRNPHWRCFAWRICGLLD